MGNFQTSLKESVLQIFTSTINVLSRPFRNQLIRLTKSSPDMFEVKRGDAQVRDSKPIVLNSRQRLFVEKLECKSESLTKMYLGAFYSLQSEMNPEALVQAAHSIREFIEKFPTIADIKVKQGPSLKDRVIQLSAEYQKAELSTCKSDSDWAGEIDLRLRRYLTRSSEFFNWFSKEHTTRRDSAKKVFSSVRKTKPLPEPIENIEADKWLSIRDYFVGVSHHTFVSSKDDFFSYMEILEEFVLQALHPRTYETMDEIDRLLEEGNDDNP